MGASADYTFNEALRQLLVLDDLKNTRYSELGSDGPQRPVLGGSNTMPLLRNAMPVGICKLCLQHRALIDSHLLPAALYKMSRWEGAPNPNPLLVSVRGSHQTSKQIKGYLLCHDCEQRFSKFGEKYALAQVNRKTGFRLLETLRASSNQRSSGGFTFYYDTASLGSIEKNWPTSR